MEIKEVKITIRNLTKGYHDHEENGVVAFDGKLDVRPPYQREFIYGEKERNAVINTVFNKFPLNTMYWAVREDGTYEIIDGQQRTISICQYVNGDFAFNFMYFHNLPADKQNAFLDYELTVYLCEGTESEKLDWFRVINIAGKTLTDQELRNAVYAGSWVSDAKRYFSKTACPAFKIGSKLLSGSALRQDYLETAIDWISKGNIEVYMGNHQHDSDASALWIYFQSVITWVNAKFKNYRPAMKGVPWGFLYNKYKDAVLDPEKIEAETKRLVLDDDVTNKKGIYSYILTGDEKYLSIRAFSEAQKLAAYEFQFGICPICGNHFEIEEMEADHITPWSEGGKTSAENCQMLCKSCNRRKSNK